MRSVVVQNSFVSGEIDPQLYDRLDIDQYERAAARIDNFRVIPQGGVTKRGGSEYLYTVDEQVRVMEWVYSTSEAYAVLAMPTRIELFNTTTKLPEATISGHPWSTYPKITAIRYRQVLDTMFLVQEDAAPRKLVKFGGYGTNPIACVSGSNILTITRPWHGLREGDLITFSGISTTIAGLPSTMWRNTFAVQSGTTDHTFKVLATTNATATGNFGGTGLLKSWVLAVVDLKNIPQVDFNDQLSPQPTSRETQRVYFLDSWATSHTFGFVFGGYKTTLEPWNGSGNMDANAYAAARILANCTPLYDYIYPTETYPAALTRKDFRVIEPFQDIAAGDTGVGIDLNGTPYLDIEFKGKYAGKNVALMLGQVGGTNPRPSISIETTVETDTKLEPVWSTTRGWPRSVEFFEGRLCFGGSKSFPASFWASVSGDYTNFQTGDAHDDEGIAKDIDVNAADAVEHLIAGRQLMAMTRRGEYYQTETPMVPESATFKQQTSHGSGSIQPCKVGGSVYFVQRNGGAVRRLLYDFREDAFSADEVSILARHLLSGPVDMATVATSRDGDYIFVVNADGVMAVLAVNKDQQVAGWSTFSGYGKFLSVATINDEVYVTTDRSPLVVEEGVEPDYGPFYLEKLLDSGGSFDASITTTFPTPATVTSGWTYSFPTSLFWLARIVDLGGGAFSVGTIDGLKIRVAFNDRVQYVNIVYGRSTFIPPGTFVADIDKNGTLTFRATADMVGKHITSITVGTDHSATLTLLPSTLNSSSGNMMLRRKRVSRITVDGSWDIGGGANLECTTPSGHYSLLVPRPVFGESGAAGTQASTPLLGWNRRNDMVTLRHTGYGACTIRGVEREIEVSGHLGEERD